MGLRRGKGPRRWINRPAKGERKTKEWVKLDLLAGISPHLACVGAGVLGHFFYFHTVFHCIAHLTRQGANSSLSLLRRSQIRWKASSNSANEEDDRKSRVIMQKLSPYFLTKPSKVDETGTKLKMTALKILCGPAIHVQTNRQKARARTQRQTHTHIK